MSIYDDPKIDCHNHVFDPARFPYAPDAYYKPDGQEIGTAAQLLAVFDAYGVENALVVGPNSGYNTTAGACWTRSSWGRVDSRAPPWCPTTSRAAN